MKGKKLTGFWWDGVDKVDEVDGVDGVWAHAE